ncbi:metallophosphoesterase [Donghicola tyrosinivorans]|uniref:Serine/threonine protein phosphatase 1 n=1 Tax=Donghicola tyrosinivorans TaxID=1652492 RepID=A0A2T0WXL7_9RHOB|nr:metallophosphoesterase [Donghicola tyrosinivorans]PRY91446.1 serine/threonine protein phosphatase 1 [Donghicola tyrosinivorans]
MRHYAIGDIHGHLDKLQGVHALIEADRAVTGDHAAPVVHLGDFADRGPDVNGVLEYMIAGQTEGRPWINILGNHDRMMWHFLQEEEQSDPLRDDLHWLMLNINIGGRKSLASYGVDVSDDRPVAEIHAEGRAKVPAAHLDFITSLKEYHWADDLYFCHAGVRPNVALDAQVQDDLVWIRKDFHDHHDSFGPLIIHGHTHLDEITHYGNRLNIDTGAAYGGPISVVVIEGRDVWELTENGRRPVTPA